MSSSKKLGLVNKYIGFAGFVIVSIMVLLLYSHTAYQTWLVGKFATAVIIFTLAGLIKGIFIEYRHIRGVEQKENLFTTTSVITFIALMAGAVVAFTLKVELGLGAVVGASLTALIASLIVPKQGVPIYCGAFIGMTSARLFISYTDLCLAAAIAGALFLLTQRAYQGFGGKLGTIAFTGTFITGFGLKREFLITSLPEVEIILPIILCAIIATAFTYFLAVHLKHHPVLASGGTSLIGGLILPNLYPGEVGSTLAVMTLCASAAGMSSPEKIPNWWVVILLGFLTGAVFIFSMPLAGGAGGKLGTIAFGAAISVHAWLKIFAGKKHYSSE